MCRSTFLVSRPSLQLFASSILMFPAMASCQCQLCVQPFGTLPENNSLLRYADVPVEFDFHGLYPVHVSLFGQTSICVSWVVFNTHTTILSLFLSSLFFTRRASSLSYIPFMPVYFLENLSMIMIFSSQVIHFFSNTVEHSTMKTSSTHWSCHVISLVPWQGVVQAGEHIWGFVSLINFQTWTNLVRDAARSTHWALKRNSGVPLQYHTGAWQAWWAWATQAYTASDKQSPGL